MRHCIQRQEMVRAEACTSHLSGGSIVCLVGYIQQWRPSEEHHNDTDEKKTDENQGKIDKEFLEVLAGLRVDLNIWGSPHRRSGYVLNFIHDYRRTERCRWWVIEEVQKDREWSLVFSLVKQSEQESESYKSHSERESCKLRKAISHWYPKHTFPSMNLYD